MYVNTVRIKLSDNSVKEIEKGRSVLEVIKLIDEEMLNRATCAEVNGKIRDLRYIINKDCRLKVLTFNNSLEGKRVYWHTTSHIMAQAVQRLFPNAKFVVGNNTDEGFFYEFDIDRKFTDKDVIKIEQEMNEIIRENIPIERFELSKKEALELMRNQPYKKELIREYNEKDKIVFYKQGDYIDLCNVPHLMSTGQIKEIKIVFISESYKKNKKLQRINATSF